MLEHYNKFRIITLNHKYFRAFIESTTEVTQACFFQKGMYKLIIYNKAGSIYTKKTGFHG